MPPAKTWKKKERQLAALFGTVRRPLSGGNSSQGERRDDAQHPTLFLECKYSARHALWKLWRFAKECCRKELRHPKRRPVIGLYETGQTGGRCLLVIHEDDLLKVARERIEALYQQSKAPSLYEALDCFSTLSVEGRL